MNQENAKRFPDTMHKILSKITLEHCVVRFVMAWCSVSIIQTFYAMNAGGNLVTTLNSQRGINFAVNIFGLLFLFVTLYVLLSFINNNKIEKKLLFAPTFSYALISVFENMEIYFAIGMIALMAFSVVYCFKDLSVNTIKISDRTFKVLLIVTGVVFVVFTASCSMCRYFMYMTPNFDFGLFSQMFHYMKTTFTMNTTCERDMLMSHMQVHISPVYWLVLPFYALCSSPATLQFMQAVIIALGLIPLSGICKNHKLTKMETLLIGVIYIAYPVMSAGTFYDMHENMFLPVAILCVLLAVENNSTLGLVASVALTLSIKEDAAVYVAFIGIYMMLYHKMYKKGLAVFFSSVAYFIVAVSILNAFGQGTLTGRFNNMILDGDGNVFGMVRTVILSPAYVLTQVLRAENIEFIFQVFAPLLFLPFFSKRWQRFVLFGPFILFNLMPDYVYARNIMFQYVFGSGTLLLYVAVLNIADFREEIRQRIVPMVVVSSVLMFVALNWKQTRYVLYTFDKNKVENVKAIDRALDLIPDDASVTATTFLCSRLSKREELYELYYTDEITDYVVIDLRIEASYQERNADLYEYRHSEDYEIIYDDVTSVAIFKRKVSVE